MNIAKLGSNIISKSRSTLTRQSPGFAKRKVPRFLYHITNPDSYSRIIESGHLKIAQDSLENLDGVYLFDLKNVLKCWNANKGNCHLGIGLLGLGVKSDKKAVILRIPTKNLKRENLKIRSLQRFASNAPEDIKHFKYGDSVKRAKHFTEKKEAIEYIYPEEIPITKENFVGISDIGKTEEDLFYKLTDDPQKQKELFACKMKELFKGTPEEKSINILL